MNHAVREEANHWDNTMLATDFVDCISNLWIGLEKEIIYDVFYPDVCNSNTNAYMMNVFYTEFLQLNLLEGRLDKKIVSECCQCLGKIVKKFLRTRDLREFFPAL